MNPSALQSLYECRHQSQEKWTLWAVAMSKAWPEMYRGLSAATEVPREPPIAAHLCHCPASPAERIGSANCQCEIVPWGTSMRLTMARVQIKDLVESWDDRVNVGRWHHAIKTARAHLDSPPPAIEVSPKLGEAMDTIKHMVNRFLGWKLPANFRPDGGISFKADYNEHTPWPAKHEPCGTNLFDATQAEAMVRYMLEGLPSSDSAAMIDSERLRWLHSPASCVLDADGYEWGIYRVKWNEYGRPFSVLATDSNFNDLDAARALLAAPIAPKELS